MKSPVQLISCDPSLGSLEDISPAQIYRANFISVVFFLHCCYRFSKRNIYLFILVFSDPILFCLFIFLSSIFPVFYFLSFSSVFLCISLILFLLMSLSLPALYLSPLTYFVYHLFSHSASISLSLCSLFLVGFLLLSFFTCLLLHSTYSFLYLFGYMRFIIILLYFFSCIFYLSFFCLPFLLIFLHFSFSFVFLILFFFLLSLIILF